MLRFTLVYDSGCGSCTRFRNAVGFHDAGCNIRFHGLEEADRSGVLENVPPGMRHRSFHLVSPSGTVWSGDAALPHLMAALPGGRPFSVAVLTVPPLSWATVFLYHVLSRLHDSGACSYVSSKDPGHPI